MKTFHTLKTAHFMISQKKITRDNIYLKKLKYCFTMLNLHPYTTGHLVVITYKHVTNLERLLKRESNELIKLIKEVNMT